MPEASEGDYVMVHVGFAISVVDQERGGAHLRAAGKHGRAGRRTGAGCRGIAKPMKYMDEYRDAKIARGLAAEIRGRSTRPWVLMEICGGQTHTLMRYGIDELLGKQRGTGARSGLPGLRDAAGDD